MDKTLKDLSLGPGDILVVQLGSEKYNASTLSMLQNRMYSIFDPVGVRILLIPEGITLSAVRFHKGSAADQIQGLSGHLHRPPDGEYWNWKNDVEYWNGLPGSSVKDFAPTEEKKSRQYRMIRADVEEVIAKLASLPPSKKEMEEKFTKREVQEALMKESWKVISRSAE